MATADIFKKQLTYLLNCTPDLHGIFITDPDGVPVLKANTDNAPELATRAQFLATYGVACDQASKMGLGHNKHVICYYGNYQLILANRHPMLVTLIAGDQASTGYLLTLLGEVDEILKDIRPHVSDVISSSSVHPS